MLNKLSNVTAEGNFEATIESADQRFALQLGALCSGRLLIIGSANVKSFFTLKIALRYAAMRTQFME